MAPLPGRGVVVGSQPSPRAHGGLPGGRERAVLAPGKRPNPARADLGCTGGWAGKPEAKGRQQRWPALLRRLPTQKLGWTDARAPGGSAGYGIFSLIPAWLRSRFGRDKCGMRGGDGFYQRGGWATKVVRAFIER